MRQRNIVAASVVLGVSFLLAMALVAWFLVRHKRRKLANTAQSLTDYPVDGEGQARPTTPEAPFVSDRSWRGKPGSKRRSKGQQRSPSLATFLKAGDEDIFGSNVFHPHNLQQSANVSLDSLYDVLADTMMARPTAERLAYTQAMSQFIAGRKSSRKRRQSVPATANEVESRLRPTSVKRRKASRSQYLVITANSFLMTEEATLPAARYSWWEMRPTLDSGSDGELTMEISPEELAALSILLACGRPSTNAQNANDDPDLITPAFSDSGAFGISINRHAPTSEGKRFVTLTRRPLYTTEQVPRASPGYSILLAKHMACGSLPFSRGPSVTACLLISRASAAAIVAGSPALHIRRKNNPDTASSKFLSSLPHSRGLALYEVAVEAPITTSNDFQTPAQLPESFLEVLARLPYTTLPPLASIPMLDVIGFVASAGLPPGRLLQRLESLIEKIHNASAGTSLFGPLYEVHNVRTLVRERDRLGKLALEATPRANVSDSLAQKTARLHRYGVLMERLTGMLATGGLGKEEVRRRINEANRNELVKSYSDALGQHRTTPTPRGSPSNGNTGTATPVPQVSSPTAEPTTPSQGRTLGAQSPQPQGSRIITRSSISSCRSGSTRRSGPSAPPNLGSQLEAILKAGLPLSVPQVAFVGRLVLVAWSLSAEKVAWEEEEEGMRFDILPHEKMAML